MSDFVTIKYKDPCFSVVPRVVDVGKVDVFGTIDLNE
jgi:hypothetical protein